MPLSQWPSTPALGLCGGVIVSHLPFSVSHLNVIIGHGWSLPKDLINDNFCPSTHGSKISHEQAGSTTDDTTTPQNIHPLFILTSDMKGKKRARRREPTPHIASKDYESPNERNGWGRGMWQSEINGLAWRDLQRGRRGEERAWSSEKKEEEEEAKTKPQTKESCIWAL